MIFDPSTDILKDVYNIKPMPSEKEEKPPSKNWSEFKKKIKIDYKQKPTILDPISNQTGPY